MLTLNHINPWCLCNCFLVIVRMYYIKAQIEKKVKEIRKWLKKHLNMSYQGILTFNSSYYFLRKRQHILSKLYGEFSKKKFVCLWWGKLGKQIDSWKLRWNILVLSKYNLRWKGNKILICLSIYYNKLILLCLDLSL